jgi:hypothetical protein
MAASPAIAYGTLAGVVRDATGAVLPIGSSDEVRFDDAGVAAFTAIKDCRTYDVRTRHTNADRADAVNVDDLKQSAVLLAVVAWHDAMRDEVLPSKK